MDYVKGSAPKHPAGEKGKSNIQRRVSWNSKYDAHVLKNGDIYLYTKDGDRAKKRVNGQWSDWR